MMSQIDQAEGKTNRKFPTPITLVGALFYLNTAIWVAFGIASLIRMRQGTQGNPIVLWVVAILMFGNAGAMLLAGWWLGKGSRLSFYFALALLAVNILLTVTDQFGIYDLVTLLIDLVLLGLLIVPRRPVTVT